MPLLYEQLLVLLAQGMGLSGLHVVPTLLSFFRSLPVNFDARDWGIGSPLCGTQHHMHFLFLYKVFPLPDRQESACELELPTQRTRDNACRRARLNTQGGCQCVGEAFVQPASERSCVSCFRRFSTGGA